MKKVCIIHSEGNINNNPNLLGIVDIMSKEGYYIDIFSRKSPLFEQKCPIKNTTLYLAEYNDFSSAIKEFSNDYSTPYLCIIGIDEAIIEANEMAKYQNTPLGFISYEITFDDELSDFAKKEKLKEIEACKNIDFAIVQDEVRGLHLSEQNKIPIEKFIYIPVAGGNTYKRVQNKYLHQKLNIDFNKKIAILIGSISEWSISDQILNDIEKWPNNWVLVLHNRYGKSNMNQKYINFASKSEKIFISEEQTESPFELHKILNSADVGLAFYIPNEKIRYLGKNIFYIGLASGKISTYLSNDLPVLINYSEPFASLNKQYKFGEVINKYSEISEFLQKIEKSEYNCIHFFNEKLNLSKTIIPLLEVLKNYE